MFERSFFATTGVACLLVVSLFSGCGKNDVVYVEGVVWYDDAPLSKAVVSFFPEESSPEALFASGMTDSAGSFKLTVRPSGEAEQGTRPGNYIVTVSRYNDEPSGAQRIPSGEMVPIFKQLLPIRYTDKGQSPLRAVVQKKSKNSFEFRLEKK